MNKKQPAVKIDEKAFQAGFAAGRQGLPSWPPPAGLDGLSWISGYIDGKADRPRRPGGLECVKPAQRRNS